MKAYPKEIVVISGGFDPVHSGHISYLKGAKEYGDYLIALLNSDDWLIKKKGKFFLPFSERKIILENINFLDEVLGFEDDEKGSCINGLKKIKIKYPDSKIIFCNGGDRKEENIPEMYLNEIDFKFGVGGNDKKNSSSSILKDWTYEREDRVWGSFYNLFLDKNIKVKELIISPNKGMSFQRHFHRNEIWFVSKGSCLIKHSKKDEKDKKEFKLNKDDIFHIKKNEWHQIINPHNEECKIIEIQYGDQVEESDIERLYYFDSTD
tara:strand:+ start:3598 stop:4389 length:792 start_codon:yes stop_codon:yes gene_type:complete